MKPTGKGRLGILVIAEAPGEQEDKKGIQLIGDSGQLFRKMLHKEDVDLDEDCLKMNAINCRPPNNREPTDTELECCRPLVWKVIQKFHPKLILLLGGIAVKTFLTDRVKEDIEGITKWRGFVIPDRDAKCWVAPLFHPSYLLRLGSARRGPKVEAAETIFRKDLAHALTFLEKPFPGPPDEKEAIRCVSSQDGAEFMRHVGRKRPAIAFDYETTGIKPHAPGHAIVALSVADRDDRSVSMLWDKGLEELWCGILADERIRKIACNMKFEDTWSNVILRATVRGWVWDTMLAAHCLDNRRHISGLKVQAYLHFGIADYASHIEPFLKSTVPNGLNRIREAPVKELLYYCGMDSLLERRLATMQRGCFK
jgi:DNA polymerase